MNDRTPRKQLGCTDANGEREEIHIICEYGNTIEEIMAADSNKKLETLKLKKITAKIGKAGCSCRALIEPICDFINVCLENGIPIEQAYRICAGVRCEHPLMGPGAKSCPDALARELKKHMPREDT